MQIDNDSFPRPPDRGRRRAGWLAGAALALLAAACGGDPDGRAVSASPVAEESLALAPWEQAYADDELTTEVRLAIRVLDRGHEQIGAEPVEGAAVELWAVTPDGFRLDRRLAEGTTDAEGHVDLGPAPERRWAVRVRKEGYAPALGGHRAALTGCMDLPFNARGILGLRPSRDVPVELRDDAGKPVAGARVEADSIAFWDQATTDAEGRATLSAPAEPIDVYPTGVAFGGRRTHVDVPADGPVPPVRLSTSALAPVSGRVVDGAHGRPVAGAWVLVTHRPWVRAQTDAEGRFSIAAFPGERIAGLVGGHGWRTTAVPEAGDVEIRLVTARPVTGTVTGPDGAPIAGARLVAIASDILGKDERVWGPRTGADGSFDFSWLPERVRSVHAEPRVLAIHRRHGISAAVVPPTDGTPLALELAGTRAIEGTFRRHDDEPAVGARILARWSVPGLDPGEALRAGIASQVEACIRPDGAFRFTAVPLGVGATIEPDLEGWRTPIALDEEAPAATVQRLEFRAPRGQPIAGTVVTRGGDPLPEGGVVGLTLLGAQRFVIDRTVPIEPDGSFVIPDVPEGRYQVTARVPGYEPGGGVANAGTSDVVVTVERRSPVKVRLRFPEGTTERPELVTVELSDRTIEASESASAANDWTATFPELWPGTYRLRASGGVWRGRDDAVEVPDGRLLELDVELTRTLRREAVLRDMDGSPLGGVQVILRPLEIEGAHPQQAHSDGNGALDLTGLREGSWLLRCTPRNRVPLEHRFEVGKQATAPLELRFAPSGDLALTVRAAGSPAADAVVSLADPKGELVVAWPEGHASLSSRFRVGDDGTLRLFGIRVGPLVVKVSGGGLAEPVETTVMIRTGETTSAAVE